MAPVRSMKCIRRPPSRLPRMLVSLGRMSSVISDWVLATVRALGLAGLELWVELMVRSLRSPFTRDGRGIGPIARYNETGGGRSDETLLFQFRQSRPITQIPHGRRRATWTRLQG